MKWFDSFVARVVEDWGNSDLAIRENVSTVASGKRSTTDTGQLGEDAVSQCLGLLEYSTSLSPRSRSPVDVWGFRAAKNVIHIPIIQVKTATFPRDPAELSARDLENLEMFTSFVWDAFMSGSGVPVQHKTKHLIVSSGYAGVCVFSSRAASPASGSRFIDSSEWLYYVRSTKLKEASVERYVSKVHAL